MKIYFHRTIVRLLYQYFRRIFYRYADDYVTATVEEYKDYFPKGEE